MRKISRKVKQALSILLVAAMVITMVPQNTLSVSAAELGVENTVDDSDTDAQTVETIEGAEGKSSNSSEEVTDSEEGEVPGEESEEAVDDEDAEAPEGEESIDEDAEAPEDGESTDEDAEVPEDGITDEEQAPEGETAEGEESAADEDTGIAKTTFEGEEGTPAEVQVTFSTTEGQIKAITEIKEDGSKGDDIKAGKSIASGATLKFSVEAETGYKVTKVAKGDDEVKADENGVYTVEDITEATTITITTEKKVTYDVSFDFTGDEAKAAQVTSVKVDGEEKIENPITADANNTVSVTEGGTVTFAVSVQDGKEYKISSVKKGGEALTAADGVYTVTVENAVAVSIATELDAEKCNVLNFSAGETGTEKTFEATVTVDETETVAYNGEINQFLQANGEGKGTVAVKVTDSLYAIDKITLDGKELKEKVTEGEGESATTTGDYTVSDDGVWSFDVEFSTVKKTQNIVVYTSPAGTTEDAFTVKFDDQTAHMTVDVTTSDSVKKQNGSNYSIEKGAKWLEFTVTSDNADYEPKVLENGTDWYYPGLEDGVLEEVSKKTENDSVIYSYKVAATTLFEGYTFTIAEATATYDIEVTYPTGSIKDEDGLAAYVNGYSYYGWPNVEGENTKAVLYGIEKGSKVVIPVEAAEGYQITKASEKVGEAAAETKEVNGTVYTYTATVTGDTAITVETEAQTEVVLFDGDEAVTPDKDGKYAVDYSVDDYTVEVRVGGVAQTLAKAEVAPEDAKSTVAADGKITLDKADAGKELTLKLTTGEGEQAKEHEITLEVAKAATADAITVEGVDKNGNANQVIDTEKEYKITVTDGVAKNNLAVEVDAAAKGVTASIAEGQLVVTVSNDAEAGTAVAIKLYDKTDDKKEAIKTIKVTPTELLDGVKPTVSLKLATDVSLKLTLGSKVSEEELVNGELWYKVVVTPDSSTTNEKLIKEAKPEYVKRTGATDELDFSVAAENVEQGDGTAANFTVAVTLIRSKNGEVTEANEKDNTAEATEAVELKTATKNPYLTTKLSLKKLVTKIYTGQKEVVAAQAVFDKNTTFTTIEVKDVVAVVGKNTSPTSKVSAYADGDKIVVSADSNYGAGKYRIYVAAVDKESTMKVAEASFDVQVQQGIYALGVSVPESLYKQEGKAASFTTTLTYNYGSSYYKPQTKKVTWEIGRATGEYDENGKSILVADPNVTIKNGKVTVNKNYTVSAVSEENEFTVRATAADYEGNTTSRSATFEITAEKAQLGSVVIAKYTDDGYDIIAKSGDEVKADEIIGADAYVLKPGVTVKDHYSHSVFGNVVSDAEVTYKSSNKAVTIGSYGSISSVTKTAKNIKITATATDGSKASAVLDKLTVTYASGEDIGLYITNYSDNNTELPVSEDGSAEFYGQKDAVFCIEIQTKDEEGNWDYISNRGLTDYTLKIKGAKTIYKNTLTGEYEIIPTGATVTLTLTSKSILGNGKNKVYTLTNKSFSDAKTNAPKLKTSDKLYGGKYQSAQKVTYTLPSGYANQMILFTLDTVDSTNSKKKDNYNWFSGYFNELGSYIKVSSDATVTLTFGYSRTYIPAGSYKLNYLVGGFNDDGNFVATAKPGTVSIKATAQKTIKASLKKAYTLSALEGSRVEFTLNKSGVEPNVLELKNANIKGTENQFLKYFEIDHDTQNGDKYYLKLVDGLSAAQITELAGNKDNLTGWVSYNYHNVDNSNDSYGEGQTQIKVTLKDVTTASKFALTKATVLNDAKTVTVNAYTGKNVAVDVADAKVTDGDFTAVANGTDTITLTPTAALATGKYNVTLKIVPADSYYMSLFTAEGANRDDLIAKYGVEVKTTITVTAKDTTKNKVKVDSKAATKTFTANDYADGYYFVDVPYTTTTQNVPTFKATAQKDIDQKLFTTDVDAGKITVKLSKAELKAAVADKAVTYGKKNYSVKFDLIYGIDGTGYTTDTITLKLTLPAEAKTYDQVKADVLAEAEKLTAGVYDAESDYMELVDAAVAMLVPADSDTTYTLSLNDYVDPSSDEEGYVKVDVALTEAGKEAETVATVTLALSKLNKTPNELSDALQNYVSNFGATNATTKTDVLTGARDAVKIVDYPNLRLVMTSYDFEKATKESEGHLNATLVLYDIYEGRNFGLIFEIDSTIDKIKTLDETADYISGEWNNLDVDELLDDVAIGDTDTAKKKVEEWAEKLLNNEDITITGWAKKAGESDSQVDDFSFTQSTSQVAGSISGQLVLKDTSIKPTEDDPDADTVTVELTEKYLTQRATLDDVESSIGIELFNLTIPNNSDEAKKAILEAVQKAIANNQITAAWGKTEGDTPADDFKFTAATYSEWGSVEFSIVLTDTALKEENTKTISRKEGRALTVNKLSQETLADAVSAAKEALDTFGKTDANISNTTKKDAIKNAVEDAVQLTDATVAWKQVADEDDEENAKDDFTLTEATTEAAGSIKGTLVITYGEESVEVEVNFEIPQLPTEGEENP